MKKFITAFMMMALLAIMLPLSSTETLAQKRYVVTRNGRTTYTTKRPSFYRRHRNAINVGAGTAGGAILGGLIGGKRGAGIGAIAGGGGSALYTYKIRPKKRRYRRVQ